MGTLGKFEDIKDDVAKMARDAGTKIEDRARKMQGKEGDFTRRIERITSAVPSSTWLAIAGGAMLGSLTLKLFGRDKAANFVGEWVPTLLLIGVYNKLVKLHGSERVS